uniref:Retrovirus-related Pol polyprotein from transposon TNT 1-94 n=1 Tax=Vitis vinifera TaxID=29760 RepID=A5AVP1_VITVI|nr:hypothetical protein VITISV_039746 [Vitis vinifera]
MTTESSFVQPAILKFDGYYDHWAMLMENFLRSKEYWGLVENGVPIVAEDAKFQGTTQVKRANLQALRNEFEILHMKSGETMNEYFSHILAIANKMKVNGEDKGNTVVVEKILRSMTSKFDYVVCSIEESKDLDTLTIDELQSSLLVHEQRMTSHVLEEEQALKVTHGDHSRSRGHGHGNYRGRERGRNRRSFYKATVECYNCHKLGHFA